MNKLIKLIWVNLLGLFDFNGVVKELEAGIKGKSEARLIIVSIASLVVGFFAYYVFNIFGNFLDDKYLLFYIGFIVSTILCFGISLMQIGPIIFKSDDTEYLFSLPLTKHQIILSKLFNIYIRNLFFCFIILIACVLSFVNFGNVNETFVLMYIINGIFIPFIPIIVSVLIYYFNYYMKYNLNKYINYLIKLIILIMIGILGYVIFKDINYSNINMLIEGIYERLRYLYATGFLFVISLEDVNIICFLIYIGINVIVVYLFMLFILKHYMKICSLLKGVKKSKIFKYGRRLSLGKLGNLRKEILLIFKNKLYYNSSFSLLVTFSIIFIIISMFISVDNIIKINDFYDYYNLYVPFMLAGFISLGNSSINSMSIEKGNMSILCTLPIKLRNILFYKWLANVSIGSIFIIVLGSLLSLLFKPSNITILLTYLVPFVTLMFVSLLSLLLDYKFMIKDESNDGVIVKQRFITLVPMVISIIILVLPIFFKVSNLYKNILFSFMLAEVILMVICLGYLFVNRKRLRKNLIN